ncbi:MAG: glycosyltransferase [Acidobacteriota bacterium]
MGTRLLVIGGFGPGQLPDSYARGFERRGLEVHRFDSDRAYFESAAFAHNPYFRRIFRPVLWARMHRATMAAARIVKPHAVMAVKGSYLDAETVRTIRRELGVPFFNYYPDHPYCGVPLSPRKTSAQRRDLIEVLKEYTRVWTWEAALVARLQSDGVSAGYLPFGVDDEVFRPDAQGPPPPNAHGTRVGGPGPSPRRECEADHRIVFVGQHSDKREAHLAAIREHAVGLWGNRWSRAAGRFGGRHTVHRVPAFGDTCAALYRSADVSLNVVDDLNMPGHNMRTFEIPGSGGVMLAGYTAEQAAIFPPGEAAMYYHQPEELDELLRRMCGDPALTARLRRHAAGIAAGHSYEHRAASMIAELGLNGRR